MGIESYRITESTTQGGGVQRVQVAFTDHLGKNHNRGYDFPKGADVDKEILVRQAHVEQGLKDQEIELVIGKIENGQNFTLQYASVAELKTRLQESEVEKQVEIDRLTGEKANISKEIK